MQFYPIKWKVNVKFNKKKITFLLFFKLKEYTTERVY